MIEINLLKAVKNLSKPVYYTRLQHRQDKKYVVKHKSAKLLMTYTVGKLEAALNISHLKLSTSSQTSESC